MQPIAPGKLPPDLLSELLDRGGELPPDVLVGPRIGEDACALDLGDSVLVAATDPITLTGREVAAYAVQVNANDVAVMGVRPRWFLATVLLPVGTTEAQVKALFEDMYAALRDVGACLVGGHTEVTPAVIQPVVVGQMLGLAPSGRVISTGGARAGDAVVQVGRAPIEGSAILANSFRARLKDVDTETLRLAAAAAEGGGISVVDAALQCTALGATSMHDPTESGLSGGLHELAGASGAQVVFDSEKILWFEPGLVVCRSLGADPWGLLASGTLIACFAAPKVASVVHALRATGFEAACIGRIKNGAGVVGEDGRALTQFARDELARLLG